MHLFTHNALKMKEKGYLIYEAKEGFQNETPLSGLKGTKIEPLVLLLTFIGDIDLDKSIDNEHCLSPLKGWTN